MISYPLNIKFRQGILTTNQPTMVIPVSLIANNFTSTCLYLTFHQLFCAKNKKKTIVIIHKSSFIPMTEASICIEVFKSMCKTNVKMN